MSKSYSKRLCLHGNEEQSRPRILIFIIAHNNCSVKSTLAMYAELFEDRTDSLRKAETLYSC